MFDICLTLYRKLGFTITKKAFTKTPYILKKSQNYVVKSGKFWQS